MEKRNILLQAVLSLCDALPNGYGKRSLAPVFTVDGKRRSILVRKDHDPALAPACNEF